MGFDLIAPIKLIIIIFGYLKVILRYVLVKLLNLVTFTNTWECYYCQTWSTFGIWNFKEYKNSSWHFWYCKSCQNVNRWKRAIRDEDFKELTEEEVELINSYTTPATPSTKGEATDTSATIKAENILYFQPGPNHSDKFQFCSDCQLNHKIVHSLKAQYFNSDENWDKIPTSKFSADYKAYSDQLNYLYPPVCKDCSNYVDPAMDSITRTSAIWLSHRSIEYEEENFHFLNYDFTRKKYENLNLFRLAALSVGYFFIMYNFNSIPKIMNFSSIISSPWVNIYSFLNDPENSDLYQFKLSSLYQLCKFSVTNHVDIAIIMATYYTIYFAYQTTTLYPKLLEVTHYASASTAESLELYMPTFLLLLKACWVFRLFNILNFLNMFISLNTVSTVARNIDLKYINLGDWTNFSVFFFRQLHSFSLYFDVIVVIYLNLMAFGICVPKYEQLNFNYPTGASNQNLRSGYATPPFSQAEGNMSQSLATPEDNVEAYMIDRMAHISLVSDSKKQFESYKSNRPISPTLKSRPTSPESDENDEMEVEVLDQTIKCDFEYMPKFFPASGSSKLAPGYSKEAIESIKAFSALKDNPSMPRFPFIPKPLPIYMEEEPELETMMRKLDINEPQNSIFKSKFTFTLIATTLLISSASVLYKIYY
ncbi:hypothetical protein CONCODRAFT_80454 [Conidiobolus coronatus NRRL 28638]|uniref:Ima1 N-terminal domain-containing protein n=1 Tax=Conidiobolus coronatus (strain ATCC 28846 / CBS 209.66 / NRRL 28638) TaxID=796925 RepID=A0A137NUX6_CONC2|nr:hypothetical protein CONCODRAFT_80454 [Conidiobolus coronatus NRRL 28638]|eukprot:KXN66557.1 hypothetical protein CONCODRAFT_80454 [Conidiobolus coronatus NRRL 28638]